MKYKETIILDQNELEEAIQSWIQKKNPSEKVLGPFCLEIRSSFCPESKKTGYYIIATREKV